MNYHVLARKWRPKDFSSLVGQEHVVRALTHALDGARLHHAYLFTGTRGVGKTTLARIFAKALNCETGMSATPCGACRACREIDEGRFVDYLEMDAASNRGVDEMAALLERAVYAPVNARFKVYMIDEVHMLSNHAFNAMLKTLEEPPPHIKFILATTDPQKIPVTVLSRCLQFNLKQMPAAAIVDHLQHVLNAEEVVFEPQALRLLARAAQGSMRDALSLADQAIAYSANHITEQAVCAMLGALDQSYLIRLLDALIAGDGALVLEIADEMALRSLSFSTALQDLASLLHRIGWAQFAPASVRDEWPEANDLRRFADAMTPEAVQLFYQIATLGRNELGLAPDEYAGFTMTLLRMLAFEPALLSAGGSGAPGGIPACAPALLSVVESTKQASEYVAAQPSPTMSSLPLPSAAPSRAPGARAVLDLLRAHASPSSNHAQAADQPAAQPTHATLLVKDKASTEGAEQAKTTEEIADNPRGGLPHHEASPARREAQALNTASPATLSETQSITLDSIGFNGDWPALVASLPLKGIAHQLAFHSELIACEGDTLTLVAPVPQYAETAHVAKLTAALAVKLGQAVRVKVEVGSAHHTAAALEVALHAERQRGAHRAFNDDPLVQTLIRDFDARILPDSIRPFSLSKGADPAVC